MQAERAAHRRWRRQLIGVQRAQRRVLQPHVCARVRCRRRVPGRLCYRRTHACRGVSVVWSESRRATSGSSAAQAVHWAGVGPSAQLCVLAILVNLLQRSEPQSKQTQLACGRQTRQHVCSSAGARTAQHQHATGCHTAVTTAPAAAQSLSHISRPQAPDVKRGLHPRSARKLRNSRADHTHAAGAHKPASPNTASHTTYAAHLFHSVASASCGARCVRAGRPTEKACVRQVQGISKGCHRLPIRPSNKLPMPEDRRLQESLPLLCNNSVEQVSGHAKGIKGLPTCTLSGCPGSSCCVHITTSGLQGLPTLAGARAHGREDKASSGRNGT